MRRCTSILMFYFVIWFFVINGIYIGMHYYDEGNIGIAATGKKKVREGDLPLNLENKTCCAFDNVLGFMLVKTGIPYY